MGLVTRGHEFTGVRIGRPTCRACVALISIHSSAPNLVVGAQRALEGVSIPELW